MRVSRLFKYTLRAQHFLNENRAIGPGHRIEVHLSYLNDPELSDDVIYEMVIHDINYQQASMQVYFDDDDMEQKVYTVPFKGISLISSPMRAMRFSPDQQVEVKSRVDPESPYGWWSARILKVVYQNEIFVTAEGVPSHYQVEFTNGETDMVPFYNIRLESFIILNLDCQSKNEWT